MGWWPAWRTSRRRDGRGSTRSRGGCRTPPWPTSSTPGSTEAACGCCGGCGWGGRRPPPGGGWVLRRLRLVVARFPRFGEALEVATFCSGTGALVAERRSTVFDGGAPVVEAVALWVHLDPDGLRPRPLPDGFEAVYGAAAGRRVRARLRHPADAPADAAPRP